MVLLAPVFASTKLAIEANPFRLRLLFSCELDLVKILKEIQRDLPDDSESDDDDVLSR